MAQRNYGWGGVQVNTDSDFGPDEILKHLNQLQGMKNREEQHAMQKADWEYNKENQRKLEVANQALKTYGSFGLENMSYGGTTYTANLNANSFGQSFDFFGDRERAWDKYKLYMDANNTTPDRKTFDNYFKSEYNSRLNEIANRFRAVSESARTSIKGLDNQDNLMRYLQKNYNADNLYRTYAIINGPDKANQILGYLPPSPKKTWKESVEGLFFKPSYTDPSGETQGGGLKTGAQIGGTLMPILGGGYLARDAYKTTQEFIKDATKKAEPLAERRKPIYERDKKGKIKTDKKGKRIIKSYSGITTEEFEKQYGVKKGEAFKGGKPSDEFIKQARKKGFGTTKAGKALKLGSKYSGPVVGGGAGHMLGEKIGGSIGGEGSAAEFVGGIGGGVGGAYGGAKAQRGIIKGVKKLTEPATQKRLTKYLAKKGGDKAVKSALKKALAKLGISAAGYLGPQALEPYSTAAGIAGTTWALYDIYQLAMAAPELMDVIYGE